MNMSKHLLANERNTWEIHEKSAKYLWSSPVIACLEARWRRSNETWINASHPLRFSVQWQRRKAYIERNGISERVRAQARRRRIKLCFPGRNARRCLSPFDARNSQRGDPGCRARRKMQLEETVVALTRESSAIHRRQPWILMDLFSPRGAFGRNDADLHYAIYARIVSRYIHGCMLTKEDGESPFAASFFSLFISFLIYFLSSPRFMIPLGQYSCV